MTALPETGPEAGARPEARQLQWLRRGLAQPGGKLPLFDEEGQRVDRALVRSCIDAGWAERWFHNPLKPDWVVCRLTGAGRSLLGAHVDRGAGDGQKNFASGDTSQA
ncbi:hypothetical protein JL100_024065 [Skermanella mucosa]|uniref:hypothetical protein n=1 Tax=Skermanella mucosa TaxID=1789672 RepID=UPI001E3764C1|nr:hypothetical protein [Skermanella mucosa]UEM20121.1 hypothetical protein JL100_024065 [Skermanella mucosa]